MPHAGKRAVFSAKDVVEVEDFQLEDPKDDYVLIETKFNMISAGTELANLQGRTKPIQEGKRKYPIYPGYAAAGIIRAVGKDVAAYKVGDRVAAQTPHATYGMERERFLHRIPDDVAFHEATFFELGATSLNGVRAAQIHLGETVVVIGLGIVGRLAAIFARLEGAAMVIGVDADSARLDDAKKGGADYGFNPSETNVDEELRSLTDGERADVVIEATGNPQAIPLALELAGRCGRVIILGSPRGTVEVDFYSQVHCRALSVIGAHTATHPQADTPHNKWAKPRNVRLVLNLIAQKRLSPMPLVSHTFAIDDAAQAFDLLVKHKEPALGVQFKF